MRLLGVIYLIAFVSLGSQILGLSGGEGISPMARLLEIVRERIGPERYWLIPSIFWFNASDLLIQGLTWAGALLAALAILGVAPVPVFFLLWLIYLSYLKVCGPFLSFQWDILLVETGFLAIFFAPLKLFLKWNERYEPPRSILWLLRWLLFRLMFSSGVVKLASGDPTWRNLTALNFHYETQPLPTWTSWYMHQLPETFQKFSVVVLFVTELIVPFLIFGPKRVRRFAAIPIIGFQVLILATGNYCFFNWLTILLCLPLFMEPRSKKGDRLKLNLSPFSGVSVCWPKWITAPVAAVILLVSTMQLSATCRLPIPWPRPFYQLWNILDPFQIVNGYGLFAVMTTERPEIIVEGSADGENWRAYEFKYKPGDPARRPEFVAPHQPRLDWQMWFAALGSYRQNPWLIRFCQRLLEGSPPVLRLLKKNPFPEAPPEFIRAKVYDYHFTDFQTKRKEKTWWRREEKGLYCPVLPLK